MFKLTAITTKHGCEECRGHPKRQDLIKELLANNHTEAVCVCDNCKESWHVELYHDIQQNLMARFTPMKRQ